MLGIPRDAERADNDEIFAPHSADQLDGIVVGRAVVAPVGEDKGVELFDHLIVYVTDVIRSDMVGDDLRDGRGELIGGAGDRGKDDRNKFKLLYGFG